ncbi:MAG: cation:proton antiporter [Alphaproteobacteria bacterium]
MHLEHLEILIPFLIAISALCQYVAWRVQLPAILFLLFAGLFLGPITGLFNPDKTFSYLLMPVVSLSVAIILFEGSLSLHFSEVKDLRLTIRNLISIGMLINWTIITIATHFIMQISWGISWLFGALVVVTGPTVIVPMLRSIRPSSQVSSILRWEGILIDPIGALLAVLVYTWLASEVGTGSTIIDTAAVFIRILIIGTLIGLTFGQILGITLRRYLVPDYLQTLTALAFVLVAFAFSNELAEESGLLAVTVMGILMANMKDVHIKEILHFKEHLSVLLISALFIILSARIELSGLGQIFFPALGILFVMQFIARPLAVFASAYNSPRLSRNERIITAWIGPRGIIAAAVSALFAFRLGEAGMDGAELLVPLTFFMIIGTVVFQSITAAPLATFLNVREPEPKGFLIVGANSIAQSLGHALQDLGFRVILASSTWVNIKEAKLQGLQTYYGNPVSKSADYRLDLVGIGHLLTVSPDPSLNSIAAMKYRREFGQKHIFNLNAHSKSQSENNRIDLGLKGIQLNPDISFAKFSSLLAKGAKIRTTELSDEFTFEYLMEQPKIIPLLAITPHDMVRVFGDHNPISPKAGWKIISLDYSHTKGTTNKNPGG